MQLLSIDVWFSEAKIWKWRVAKVELYAYILAYSAKLFKLHKIAFWHMGIKSIT